MIRRHFTAAALVVAILGGCRETEPPPAPYVPAPERVYAPECTSDADPKWLDLPDRAAKRSESVRNYRENKARFQALERLRAVCRASHNAHQG